jgi:magnesium transporter
LGSRIVAVIALAIPTNLVAGALGGILIPQLLYYCRIDPWCRSALLSPRSLDAFGYGSL